MFATRRNGEIVSPYTTVIRPFEPVRVMIVDDKEPIPPYHALRLDIQAACKEVGHTVVYCGDTVAGAVRVLQDFSEHELPNVLIVDQGLRGRVGEIDDLGGQKVVQAALKRDSCIQVVSVSSSLWQPVADLPNPFFTGGTMDVVDTYGRPRLFVPHVERSLRESHAFYPRPIADMVGRFDGRTMPEDPKRVPSKYGSQILYQIRLQK